MKGSLKDGGDDGHSVRKARDGYRVREESGMKGRQGVGGIGIG
jgi:hypothetical protein